MWKHSVWTMREGCFFLLTKRLVFAFQVKYVDDDSTIFWAVGPDQSVLADRVEHCGKEVELTIPLEGAASGEVTIFIFFISCWRSFTCDTVLLRISECIGSLVASVPIMNSIER